MSIIVVAGASSFVGSHVVPELLESCAAERFRWGRD